MFFFLDSAKYTADINEVQKVVLTTPEMRFVPDHLPPDIRSVECLSQLISCSKNILVLTGAGISTESGLPDYRSVGVGLYARSNRRPISYSDFISTEHKRQRYWARNFSAWPYFSKALPNRGHMILSKWLDEGRIFSIITQNIDGLHQASGAKNVLELHGNSHNVLCLQCGHNISRSELQDIFMELNPMCGCFSWFNKESDIAPDGDIEISDSLVRSLKIPNCFSCGSGILKPDVVFFGENLPKERKLQASSLVSRSDLLMVLGTTLQTFSSFRLALQAREENITIVVVNIGPTRADSITDFKLESGITETLEHTCKLLE